jgi:hypothetical protein
MFPETYVPVMVKGTETDAPPQNGEPDIVPVVIVCRISANTKNRSVPMAFDPVIPYVPTVPARDAYEPAAEALPPMASKGVMAVCRVKETELFVKLPAVASDQYSELLMPSSVIPSADPPDVELNASTCAVTVPVPVVGLTSAKGR